ncbi:hypothetical protein [Winogradskyella flava]|uniref:Uncharacterized protein n=1 Tax=Winogradskyella flava TaxID=1884876 RepID=A0A842IU20_9FLAO|nr:hypothetical protein [Winogradskyella flava]MBC2846441.1 hypothetical protein [Winogradskyella flava]
MNKRLTIIIFTISSFFIYGQKTTFEKNVNYKARALTQVFNENDNSLTLKSEDTISRVDIFNDDYSNSIEVNNIETKIDLNELPIGEFIVQAKLGKKHIIMYLTKSETNLLQPPNIEIILNEDTEDIKKKPDDSLLKKAEEKSEKITAGYWIVYERYARSGSSKSMRLESKEVVAEMISKNQLELSTEIGKNNKLIVYEVYDTSKFMREQIKNRQYFKSSDSKIFNIEPYYSSTKQNYQVATK